jgi:CDP-glucose 4,6-dehydratase
LNRVNIIALRAGNVIGGGDIAPNRLIPDFIRAIKNEEKLKIRNPENTRPWQHVLDCIYGYLTAVVAIEKGFEFDSINIGPRENSLSVKEIVNLLKNSLPNSIDVSFYHHDQINIFTEAEYLELNSSFAQNNLCWKNEYSAEQAVKITSDWWNNIFNNSEDRPYFITIDQINNFLKLKEFN